MNPNPYRSAIFALAMLGIIIGSSLWIVAVAGSNIAESSNLGVIGGFLLGSGCSVFLFWLMVSAIIYGLTTAPAQTAPPMTASWLGSAPADGPHSAGPDYLDEDGR